jgi:predicted O-linked N-acetylglucosamine transferase (SPINDLY family)
MGVPVVTKLGNSIPSRSGGAILNAIGLSDWVADSADGYVAIAMKYAAMPGALKGLRSKLPAIVAESEASNCVKYTRAVEAAYRRMWREYCGVT